MSFGTLLEAARIIEDREAHQAHVPQMRVEPPTWHHHQAVAPMIETIDSADERVVPRSNRADSPKPYARNPETHNEVEKRRRAYLTQCYVELQSVVPSIADCKASNVTVLRSAADYVQKLRADQQRLVEGKKRELQRRTQLLERLSIVRAGVSQAPQAYVTPYYAHGAYVTPMAAAAVAVAAPAVHAHPASVMLAMPPRGERAMGSVSPLPMAQSPVYSHTPTPGDDTETEDEDEEGVVPDTMSRGASPSRTPVEGLTELDDRIMALVAAKKHRRDGGNKVILTDVGNARSLCVAHAGKGGHHRIRRPVQRRVW
mmetsp:Transcript_21673/g.64706  ORF Transcript_21673/g.64706 Transcript_21673/m.64706 type:complete len:314 (+) Transcript_21673:171-1112(+)|eukprot:CAMPEP_0182915796 /NCGR_PEP_ID=MMETSP0105_2-20130417/544_1 /TAXON_ID=81532 ORGANISM="Acanthoeca-like sp., Strain 10tr" /NCGR_SAMPLE_ID=MMETSP0105_2 /ASSEMBLY_ACC=CAM_ASM_000205 /LENGTH=313 /DNA_ID=CAMNT_0025052685 /DNA_START=146 /DNA_END=1084 /DNA_ORIENTATION=-